MKEAFTILLFISINLCVGQTNINPLFIKGRLFSQIKNPNNYLPFGTVIIKGTRIGAQADSLGYYSIDVTTIADTAKSVTLVSSYPGLHTKEIFLKNKITKTMEIDFVLIPKPDCELPDIGDGKKKVNSKKRQ